MAGRAAVLKIPAVNVDGHSLDREAIPDHTLENIARVIFKEVRTFFSDPKVQEDYERWLVEYRKTHSSKGGEP